jgi:hypothetical protein
MNLQAMIDGMSAGWQKERAESQMTLGKLIDKLDSLPPETKLEGFGEPHSYRGYYSDLAFEKTDEWLAFYRSTGMKIMDILNDGTLEIAEDEF